MEIAGSQDYCFINNHTPHVGLQNDILCETLERELYVPQPFGENTLTKQSV